MSPARNSLHFAFVLTRADAIGGATVHVRDLARGLEDAGHRVVVLVGGGGEVLDDLSRHHVEYRSLRWMGRPIHPVRDVLAVAELRGVLANLKPDLVCAHTAKAGLVGRLAAAWAGLPSLYTPHGWSIGDRVSRTHAWVFRAVERIASRFSEGIINVCEAERSLARRHGIAPDSKFSVIHNGVPDVDPTLQATPDMSPATILMVARFDPPKDHPTLLSAMARMQETPWRLELVGNGPGREAARRLTGRLGLTSRVRFTDGSSSVARTMAGAQIFVLSSRSEALPLSILEAMRAGLPVVASDVGGVREAVVDGETGFLVKPGDSQALSEALRELTGNTLLRRRFGAAGRRRYELHFTFDQMLGQTVAMYYSVLPSRLEAPLSREAISGR
jgi:glycosyltransferase involved in cell wall biosynthesis